MARPHGLAGELRIRLFNLQSQVLLSARRVRLSGELRSVRGARRERDAILLRLAGCDDRVSADALRGAIVEVMREDLPETEEGEFYFHDLTGLRAIGPDGVEIGQVVEVVETAAHATVVIGSGDRRLEVPFAEAFVGSVDLQGRTIRLQGLEELPGWEEFWAKSRPC
ncbi:MAG: 16S rRNA processing protein RimM [Deltaproteobacteria bacterium]|nr:16S rRNA processing protein RimM [Deltaproteobacteria bacterium]